ncbi:MAG: APC family permease [Armatimonadetes bacterium]|nr:APC family permease [Armatimonadota bacterium]
MFSIIRRMLFGRPLASARQSQERLSNFLALPVFSSDAVSSVAYGPEEMLLALMVAGAIAWTVSLYVGGAIALLIVIVTISYRQTIFAYPQGGGSYTVATENLGRNYGLVAAAALLTDYVLTVAVSIASGVFAFISAYPQWAEYRTEICVVCIFIVALANLRGLRDSGALFVGPMYLFTGSLFVMCAVGIYKVVTGAPLNYVNPPTEQIPIAHSLGMLLILRAFSNGCSAMTGIESVAVGVPAFKPPESRNAAAVMSMMAVILISLVLGITFLARTYRVFPSADETVISQMARSILGRGTFYLVIQISTFLVLVLAANTAFQGFPRLASMLARDRYAPRQLTNIGDKLVFSNGIVLLAAVAAGLLIKFHGDVHSLIPLYAIGVFISFTLSQTGMGFRQLRMKHKGWQLHSGISFAGATITCLVAIVIGVTKFVEGAYIALALIAVLIYVFHKIHQHYVTLGNQLRLTPETFEEPQEVRSTAIVLTSSIHKGILPALEYARTLSHDCRALFIEIDPIETAMIRERWDKYGLGVPLVILESPYRSMIGPILAYLREVKKERPNHVVTVVLPEFVPRKWWHKLLHNQSGLFLKIALMMQHDIVFTNVRYYIER